MAGRMHLARLARLLVATIAALAAAGAALVFGFTQHALILNDTVAAARLNPISSEALSEGAASAVARGNVTRAEVLARAAIGTSPFTPIAFSSLAFVRERQKSDREVAPLMAAAARLSWADEAAQLSMIGQAVEEDRLDEAVLRSDGLLRQRRIRQAMFAFLRGLSMQGPPALVPLAERLATRPRWRQDFLTQLAQLTPESYEAHEQLLIRLKKTQAPPTREEVDAYVFRLINERRYAEGRAAWSRLGGGGGDGLVADPTFQRTAALGQASPFAWTLNSVPGTSLSPRRSPGDEGAGGLHITAEGRPSGRALEQVVVLAPGAYRLIIEAREIGEGSLQSLRWDLTCLGGSGRVEISTAPAVGQTEAWKRIEHAIIVPALACPAQRLELHLDHDAARDLDAWIRRVEIRPAN